MNRRATIDRQTTETQIQLTIDLDGTGTASVNTGVGFLDHMLELFARHGCFDLEVTAQGDLHIDDHHTVEDTGICLGQAIRQAVGDKRGIYRYGHMTLPMDETLVTVAVDLSGRMACVWKVELPTEKIGTFDTELGLEFWTAMAGNCLMNYHAVLHHGSNSHHILEAIFKASARALRQAVSEDPRQAGRLPSTKEML